MDPSSLCTLPTRGVCSRSAAGTVCLSLWPTPPPWTWTRRAASSVLFSSARRSAAGLRVRVCSDLQTPSSFIMLILDDEPGKTKQSIGQKKESCEVCFTFCSEPHLKHFDNTGFVGEEEKRLTCVSPRTWIKEVTPLNWLRAERQVKYADSWYKFCSLEVLLLSFMLPFKGFVFNYPILDTMSALSQVNSFIGVFIKHWFRVTQLYQWPSLKWIRRCWSGFLTLYCSLLVPGRSQHRAEERSLGKLR